MGLQTLPANKNVNQSVINQIILPVERTKLPVKYGWLAAALWRLIALYPIRLAANLVESVIDGHVPIQNSRQFPSQCWRTRNQTCLRKLVWKRPSVGDIGHSVKWSRTEIQRLGSRKARLQLPRGARFAGAHGSVMFASGLSFCTSTLRFTKLVVEKNQQQKW